MHSQSDVEESVPIWLDCDPGHDDAYAILLAAHHPRLKLLGISTVHGNAPITKTTINAHRILLALGKSDQINVHTGSHRPLCRAATIHSVDIHGVSGLDGTDLLPELPDVGLNEKVQDLGRFDTGKTLLAIRDALLGQPADTAWLVATGALTTIALLLTAFPELVAHIRGLSIMGGATGNLKESFTVDEDDNKKGARIGNTTPWAEFNIYCDPEAAAAIFSNDELAAKTTLVTIDLTHQVIATGDVQTKLFPERSKRGEIDRHSPSSQTLRPLFHDLLLFFFNTYRDVFGMQEGPPMHDPVAVAVVLETLGLQEFDTHDKAVGNKRYEVRVSTGMEHPQTGRTIATLAASERGVRIPQSINIDQFWSTIDAALCTAEHHLASNK